MKPIDVNHLVTLADKQNAKTRIELAIEKATPEQIERANVHLLAIEPDALLAANNGKYFLNVMELNPDEIPNGNLDNIRLRARYIKGAAAIVYYTVKSMFPHVELTHQQTEEKHLVRIRVWWKLPKEVNKMRPRR
jgi:hypothetical protein